MAPGVVDRLEAVQVEEQQGKLPAVRLARPPDRPIQPALERPPVRQAGQRIAAPSVKIGRRRGRFGRGLGPDGGRKIPGDNDPRLAPWLGKSRYVPFARHGGAVVATLLDAKQHGRLPSRGGGKLSLQAGQVLGRTDLPQRHAQQFVRA